MKVLIKLISLVLVLVFISSFLNYYFLDDYNANTLFGSFTYKNQRAASLGGNKFIVIGGSASNLGFDSCEFETLSGSPAVNLAISAGIPLRVYMKAAENVAKPGDTIFMVLEYGYYASEFRTIDEVYVDMVNICPDLKCSETAWGFLKYYYTNFLRSFTRLNDSFLFALKKGMNVGNTIYVADSVDEYGDFYMHKDRASTYVRTESTERFVYQTDTLSEIRSFISKMEEKGVSVFLSYPPMDGYSYTNYEAYFSDVQDVVEQHIPKDNLIGTPFDFLFDESCFFDTIYHLNYESRQLYTQILFEQYMLTRRDFP